MAGNDSVLIKLRAAKDTLTPVERKVADYVEEYLDDIPKMSIKKLAQNSCTSEASVLRFCKTIGYGSYREFIVGISLHLGGIDESVRGQYTDIRPGDNLDTIISNISFNNCKSIEDTLSVLDENEIARAVGLLRSTDRVDFYGVGANIVVCEDARQKFSRINMNCHAYVDTHSQLTAAALLRQGDVIVLFSNSGMTEDILQVLDIAKAAGATVIAVTRYSKSPLAQGADVLLSISTPEITIRSGAMGSRIAMLNIVDILFVGVASLEYSKVKTYLTKTHNILSMKRRT